VITQLSADMGSIALDGWVNGSTPAVEVIQVGDRTIDASGIDVLLQAMAGFTAPQGDLASLTPESRAAIEEAMAVAWKEVV